jgi:hypothetical protein
MTAHDSMSIFCVIPPLKQRIPVVVFHLISFRTRCYTRQSESDTLGAVKASGTNEKAASSVEIFGTRSLDGMLVAGIHAA